MDGSKDFRKGEHDIDYNVLPAAQILHYFFLILIWPKIGRPLSLNQSLGLEVYIKKERWLSQPHSRPIVILMWKRKDILE